MSTLTLETVNYTYQSKYQRVDALKDISLAFDEGKFYALIGRSGSGKTTLLSLLAGLDLPTEGKVFYHGTPTSQLNLDLYRRDEIAVIYQSYNLFPLMTVMENVMFPLSLKKVPKCEARSIAEARLRAVGIDEQYFHRFPGMLSGGEQQRIAIARALASGAKIILADEPTGNLDSGNAEIVIDLLQKLVREQGYCVVVVTHDHSIAEKADEIVMLKDGAIQPQI